MCRLRVKTRVGEESLLVILVIAANIDVFKIDGLSLPFSTCGNARLPPWMTCTSSCVPRLPPRRSDHISSSRSVGASSPPLSGASYPPSSLRSTATETTGGAEMMAVIWGLIKIDSGVEIERSIAESSVHAIQRAWIKAKRREIPRHSMKSNLRRQSFGHELRDGGVQEVIQISSWTEPCLEVIQVNTCGVRKQLRVLGPKVWIANVLFPQPPVYHGTRISMRGKIQVMSLHVPPRQSFASCTPPPPGLLIPPRGALAALPPQWDVRHGGAV
ncbi:hypothetical protein C8J57DRAFT_1578957 [Mycena rebaudengoi]|nr:hypothetical protein C8J57DRAFT_1578957 [Mycena rebaudengoi]